MRKHDGCQVGEESSKGVKRKTSASIQRLLGERMPPGAVLQSLAVAYTCVVSERSAGRRYRYILARKCRYIIILLDVSKSLRYPATFTGTEHSDQITFCPFPPLTLLLSLESVSSWKSNGRISHRRGRRLLIQVPQGLRALAHPRHIPAGSYCNQEEIDATACRALIVI